jgi:hypothetical protein
MDAIALVQHLARPTGEDQCLHSNLSKEFGAVNVYGWMPEIDPEVIKSLVPDD